MRRPLTVALTLLVVGAALLALAAGQTWVTAHVPAADLVSGGTAARDVPLTGNQLAGGLSALALAALAAGAALLSTRGRGRSAVAVLTALIGVGATVLAVHTLAAASRLAGSTTQVAAVVRTGVSGRQPTSATGWPVLGIVAAVLVAVAGLSALRGAAVSRGLSSRYEPPAAAAAETPIIATLPAEETGPPTPEQEAAAWSALDRGEDPTLPDRNRP